MNLMTFSNDSAVRCFITKFIANESVQSTQSVPPLDTVQLFTLQFYYCLVKDTMHALSIYVDLLMVSISTREGHRNLNKFESDFAGTESTKIGTTCQRCVADQNRSDSFAAKTHRDVAVDRTSQLTAAVDWEPYGKRTRPTQATTPRIHVLVERWIFEAFATTIGSPDADRFNHCILWSSEKFIRCNE